MEGKIVEAIVDTGSAVSLITESSTKKMGKEINKRKNPPCLQGITTEPLRILGMTKIELGVGSHQNFSGWIPVVPDSYLNADLLLGCDILNLAPLYWDGKRNRLVWGDTPYIMGHVKVGKRTVRRITEIPPEKKTAKNSSRSLTLPYDIKIEPFQSQLIKIKVSEEPGATLIISPNVRVNLNSMPYLTKVNEEREIFLPVVNTTRKIRILKIGTFMGFYDQEEVNTEFVRITQQIHNDLLPHSDNIASEGSRQERLKTLIKTQDWRHLNKVQREELTEAVLQNEELFSLDKSELGLINGPLAKINVADPQPSRGPQYRYPEQAKKIIAEMLTDMEKRDIIEKSTSAWLSPIVLVNKPDGSKRMCLDYRHVNKHLSTDIYPLPRVEELIEQAAGNKYYATLDMKEAYFQIKLDQGSRDLTTFSDGVTLYRFKRLPFGLSCAPAIFTRHMSSLLTPLLNEGYMRNYLDDLIVWAPDFTTLVKRLMKLFTLLRENGVKLNLSKCEIGKKSVTFLGHQLSEAGSKPDPKNIDAVMDMKTPKNCREIRRFLGMCGFYRKHVPGFARIATPLTNLTKKNAPFDWTENCSKAFEALKEKLTHAPVLVRAQIDQPFILTTDASNTHVGGVLSQIQQDGQNKPIAYFSKKLNSTEGRYSVTDKEALAIVLACRHFHHYLWGSCFTVVTDHQPLTTIFKRKTKSPRMNRWILEMREYSYQIRYIKGKENVVADQLSRPVRIIHRAPVETYLGYTPEEYKEHQRREPRWREVIEYLEGGALPSRNVPRAVMTQFAVLAGVLYFVREKSDGSIHYCLMVPHELKRKAIQHSHELIGHLGQKKTIKRAEEMFYWENMKVDIVRYVKECVTCQRFKGTRGLQQTWKELPTVSKPLERVGIDLADMVTGRQGNRYVLSVVDHFSRYVKFYPLTSKHSHNIVEALRSYVTDYGAPESIVLDNGGEFTSQVFQRFAQRHAIHLYYTTPYHPRGNAVVERMHRTLKSILANLCQGHPLRWPQLLPDCQTIMNSAVHGTTGHQPYFAFFARHAPRNVGIRLPEVEGEPDDKEAVLEVIRETQEEMCRRYRTVANRGRKDISVQEGALVWVKRETGIPGTSRKLNVRWGGPYRVVEVIRGGGAYLVEDVFTGQKIQRAAEKIKVYHGDEGWILNPQERVFSEDHEEEPVPPRQRRAPRRLIAEC